MGHANATPEQLALLANIVLTFVGVLLVGNVIAFWYVWKTWNDPDSVPCTEDDESE